MTPAKIGKYTVVDLLGRGGMGEVYLGEDPYIGRRVAIKVIKGADPGARDRFLHEAKVIGGLAHPAIVSLLDFDFSGDEPFLVMEYLKGQGLDAWIKEPHSLTEQLVVLDDVCHALSYAHESGVLHRDVKPSNVQVLPNGHAKLMDFGIARAAAGKLTATGSVMGTPEYMAPEILNDAAYSPRSDLYACAVLLYEMFTGANPFAAKTVAAALTNVLTLNPPDIRAARPELPKRLAEAVMACLHKEPALRPDGFGALLAAARDAAGGPPPAAIQETRALPQTPSASRPSPPPKAAAPEPRRSMARWMWGTGTGLIVVLGTMWAVNRGPVAPGPVEPAAASPSPEAITATPGPSLSPTSPPAAEPTAVAPRTRRGPREPSEGSVASPSREEPMPTPAPIATPAPSLSASPATPSPTPRTTPLVEPTVIATPVQAPPSGASPVAPRVLAGRHQVRPDSSADIDIKGEGLRPDLKAVVLQGRLPATGIRILRQEFVNSGLIRVRILIEAATPLRTYSIVFQDASGAMVTQGVQVEVVL
ncbi:MAG: protein kinase [Vicinamibacteria bacterium]|nr:protein kinase [Vicinamibacteria bacterium]